MGFVFIVSDIVSNNTFLFDRNCWFISDFVCKCTVVQGREHVM
jgi:hypothetical protein